MKFNLPNLLTSCNLFTGSVAAVMIFRNHLDYAAYLVLLAAFFDLLDGMAARKKSIDPAFGKELDSLADAVSFGFIPGAMLFKLMQASGLENYFHSEFLIRIFEFSPFIITVFSALRLAKFNLDTRQTTSFIGLPTPANTIMIISLPLILQQFPGKFDSLILNPYALIGITVVFSFLLISELPLFSLKFKSSGFSANKFQYILILFALVLIPVFLFAAIPMLIILYILLSVIQNLTQATT